jgi:hypothetical protein
MGLHLGGKLSSLAQLSEHSQPGAWQSSVQSAKAEESARRIIPTRIPIARQLVVMIFLEYIDFPHLE